MGDAGWQRCALAEGFQRPDLASWIDGAAVYAGVGSRCLALGVLGDAVGPAMRIAVVVGQTALQRGGPVPALVESLRGACAEAVLLHVAGEPGVEWVDAARQRIRDAGGAAAVVSIGGGSVLDAGKALAALLCESAPAMAYLEGVGTQQPGGSMLPWLALPTTGGTGSEASVNAVLSGTAGVPFKKSLRHPCYRPAAVILDGALMSGLPPTVLATTGMDALTQLLESYLSAKADVALQGYLATSIAVLLSVLPRAVEAAPAAAAVDCQMLLEAAFASGVGLAKAGLGTVHGFAGPIGALTSVAHGLACARLLGPCLSASYAWLCRHADSPAATTALAKLDCLAVGSVSTQAWVDWVATLADRFGLPWLETYWPADVLAEDLVRQVSNRENPARLEPDELRMVLSLALHPRLVLKI